MNKQARIAALEARIARLQTKIARSAGAEIVWGLIDQRAFMKVWKDLGKEDEQAADLLYQVLTTLQDKFEVKDNDYRAFNRVRQLVKAGSKWKPDLQRNNIFKAADMLGIKLPTMMFASDRTAGYKSREKMEVHTDLDIKVISGGWNDDVTGPSQPLYNGTVKYKAKVYAVGSGLLGNPVFWESSGTGQVYSDPGGGFYFDPKGGIKTGNKGLNTIVFNSLNEAVQANSGKITRTGSLRLSEED